MAPIRTTSKLTISSTHTKKKPTTTTKISIPTLPQKNVKQTRSKRKANSPPLKESSQKRSALEDVTNNALELKAKNVKTTAKKVTVQQKVLASVKTAVRVRQNENFAPPIAPAATRVKTRASTKAILPNETAQKPKDSVKVTTAVAKVKRLSNEFEKTEDSLYSTALEDM